VIVQELAQELELRVISPGDMLRAVQRGYASDLLSCVMAKAKPGTAWLTLQAHPNVVAVASLLDLAAVILTEGVEPDLETIERARENMITLLGSPETTFTVAGRMSALGILGAG
jgi:hypothetical protein